MIVDNGGVFGDLKVFKVKIKDADITQAVQNCIIYQSIFQYFWSAELFLMDTTNLIMRLPILPGDKVTIEVQTQVDSQTDDAKIYEFVIQSIPTKITHNHIELNYVLNLINEKLLKNHTVRVAQSFTDTQTNIVKTITSEYLRSVCDAPYSSSNNVHVIIPNWSPMAAISWLSKSALHNNAADYVFFQTDNNRFAFKPFERLYSSKAESCNVEFNMKPTNVIRLDKDTYDYNLNITKMDADHYDILQNINAGLYSSKTNSYDFTTKKWNTFDFKFGDDNRKDLAFKPSQNPNIDQSGVSSITFNPYWDNMHKSNQTIHNEAQNWIGSRKSSVQKLDQEKLTIQTNGGAGSWRFLGKNCKINIPSQQDWDEGIEFDKYFRGTYVIIAIAHHISKASYTTNYTTSKKRHNMKMN